ncbi:hypothetical protein K474DRAFT_1773659, partial [Panus rudis PR-1116 ss-1]
MDPHKQAGEIIGVTLTVNGLEPGPTPLILPFHKDHARVIQIGRKSTQTPGSYHISKNSAMFRCAVVSRIHAKITFTEYGNVYITDLNSHHGTYILRPGDTAAKSLSPEVPNVLADGDVVTFGKTVMRDDVEARPVSARITLQLAPPNPPITPPAPTAEDLPVRQLSTASSGRYGIFNPTESSSEEDSDSELGRSSPLSVQSNDNACLPSMQSLRSANLIIDCLPNSSAPAPEPAPILPSIHNLAPFESVSADLPSISYPAVRPSAQALLTEPPLVGSWPKTPPQPASPVVSELRSTSISRDSSEDSADTQAPGEENGAPDSDGDDEIQEVQPPTLNIVPLQVPPRPFVANPISLMLGLPALPPPPQQFVPPAFWDNHLPLPAGDRQDSAGSNGLASQTSRDDEDRNFTHRLRSVMDDVDALQQRMTEDLNPEVQFIKMVKRP